MAERPPDEQSRKVADSLRDLQRQLQNGSARAKSAEKKLSKLSKSRGRSVSKNTDQLNSALEQASTARERLLAELGRLASALESGRERDIATGEKRVQQSQKVLADAVKGLERSKKSRGRESAPGGGTGDQPPDIDQLAREIYEELLRQLEMFRQRTEDPYL